VQYATSVLRAAYCVARGWSSGPMPVYLVLLPFCAWCCGVAVCFVLCALAAALVAGGCGWWLAVLCAVCCLLSAARSRPGPRRSAELPLYHSSQLLRQHPPPSCSACCPPKPATCSESTPICLTANRWLLRTMPPPPNTPIPAYIQRNLGVVALAPLPRPGTLATQLWLHIHSHGHQTTRLRHLVASGARASL
jgi:hypothetical protein